MKHLIESIASRRSGKYEGFPMKPDLNEIEDYLISNGFKRFFRNTDYDSELSLFDWCNKNGCFGYSIGPNVKSRPRTVWISFSDGRTRWFCRCCEEKYKDSYTRKENGENKQTYFSAFSELRDDIIDTLRLE